MKHRPLAAHVSYEPLFLSLLLLFRETMRVTAAKVGFVLPKVRSIQLFKYLKIMILILLSCKFMLIKQFFEDLVGPSAPSESASQKADAK